MVGMAQKKTVAVKQAPRVAVQRPHGVTGTTTSYSLYTEEVHRQVCESVAKGRSLKDSGLLAGLGKETLDTWMYQGRHDPEKYPHLAKLVEDIEVARAERRAEAVDAIVQVGQSGQPGSWQSNAWYLERTDPENWGRKDKVEHVNDAPKQQINQVILVDSGAREAAFDLLERVAGHASPDITVGPGSSMQLEAGAGSGGGEPE